jgi:glycosyltransferase involved in cell wall biosynthesis
MTAFPTISVIVATYKQPRALEWLLRSLGEQRYRGDYEVLVCDDGSPSEVLDVVARTASQVRDHIRYVWQPDRGCRPSRSRNNGIRLAQGEVLVFLDADQVVDPEFLIQHARAHGRSRQLAAGPVKRITVGEMPCSADDALHVARSYDDPACFPERQGEWARSAHPWMSVLSANMSCRRQPEVSFDEGFIGWGGEDREFAYRLTHQYSYDITFVAAAPSYHISTEPPTRLDSHERIVGFLRNRLHFRARFPDGDLSPVMTLVEQCHLDRETNRWYAAPRNGRSSEEILREAAMWIRTHGVEP